MIPAWLWEDRRTPQSYDDRTDGLEDVAESLGSLSNETRLRIVSVLADADGALAYSELQRRTDVPDNGRLNYHLRQLRDGFLTEVDDGYRLTEFGQTVFEQLVRGGSR